MCFSRNISQWRLNIDKIFLPWTDYTAMLFLRLFPNSQPQTTPAVPSPKTSLTILACLLSLLLLLSAPLQNLCARGVGAQNTKIKHVLKISEPNWKLSLKFSMTPGPGKLQKLIICYRRKRKGNNLGYWLHTSNGNLPPQNSWHSQLKHTKLRLIPPSALEKEEKSTAEVLKILMSSPDFYHCHSRFYPAHNVFPHLSVCLRSLSKIIPDFLTGLV